MQLILAPLDSIVTHGTQGTLIAIYTMIYYFCCTWNSKHITEK